MESDKALIKIDDPKSIFHFLQQPATKLAEFLTGFLVSDTNDYKLSAGHLIQASIKLKLFTQLGKEIKKYIEKGKIDENFLKDDLHKQSLSDLLKFIDEESPEEDRFDAIKALFFKSVSNEISDKDQLLTYQIMKICTKLESSHFLILKAAYDINQGKLDSKLKSQKNIKITNVASAWLANISNQIGHGISSLVDFQEKKLVEFKLISPRKHSDESGILNINNYRLKDLGYKICELLYDDKPNNSKNQF